MLCIWWDQLGVVYYELLQPNERITGKVYRRQLMRLNKLILEGHAITISSAAKYANYVFFVDHEIRAVAGDPLVILYQTLQRWQRRHIHCT
ncbi:hypothetical protein LAZ67_12003569 [Cordylochernes scorpioides]|uniref:Uncharacterized protein n=1 Tax=Cordylochernes scorpioides TaxID=51811 RepID=A0ABY6L7B2_9ARAC|nr:hypothetical protein LAZ67_12003569 [Cordylochernes scorpioides]